VKLPKILLEKFDCDEFCDDLFDNEIGPPTSMGESERDNAGLVEF